MYKKNETKNLRHIWSILCTSSVLDKDSNNLSLNNLVEQFTAVISKVDFEKKEKNKTKGFVINTKLQLISRFQKKIKESNLAFEYKLDLIDLNGNVIDSTKPLNVAVKKGIRNIRLRNDIPRLIFNEKGIYHIRVSIKETGDKGFTVVDEIPLEIIVKIQ